eukprot:jgi/Galph1/4750/GphlegSOOS_G3370.1
MTKSSNLDWEFEKFQREIQEFDQSSTGQQTLKSSNSYSQPSIIVASKPVVHEQLQVTREDPQKSWQQEVLARDFELSRAYNENKPRNGDQGLSNGFRSSAHASYLYKTSNLQSSSIEKSRKNTQRQDLKRKKVLRTAAGEVWEDPTLLDWPENDFRLFVGDLGYDATDELLETTFGKFPGYNNARVAKDKRTGKCKGYGFVSFSEPEGMIQAMKTLNGKYIGSRPCKLRKSTWKERTLTREKKPEVELLQQYRQRLKKT